MNETPEVHVRAADPADEAAILSLIDALAAYEKLDPPDDQAKQRLMRDAFGPDQRFEIFLAQAGEKIVGYAFVFETYSSFLALPSLYLEDLFVAPEHRGTKAGFALFRHCVAEAERRGCGRMEWMVLDWNKLARDFYDRLGTTHLDNWCAYRLNRDDFRRILTLKRSDAVKQQS